MPLFGKRKVKVTKEEFAKVLFVWVIRSLSEDRIKQEAELQRLEENEKELKLFGIDLNDDVSVEKLLQELLVFNMWSVIVTCETLFKNDILCFECLDKLHSYVFSKFLQGKDKDFKKWKLAMAQQYQEYNDSFGKKGELGPVYNLVSLFNIKVYGKLNLDAIVQLQIGNYIFSSMKAVESLIKSYSVKE